MGVPPSWVSVSGTERRNIHRAKSSACTLRHPSTTEYISNGQLTMAQNTVWARDIPLHAISSLVRDLSMLSSTPHALEQAILNRAPILNSHLKSSLSLRRDIPLAIGDIVVFSPKNDGGYK